MTVEDPTPGGQPAADQQAAAEPTSLPAEVGPDTADQPGSAAPAAPADAAAAAEDPVRARFREALDRKRARQTEHAAGPDADATHPGVHGAAGRRRTFRRKSGS